MNRGAAVLLACLPLAAPAATNAPVPYRALGYADERFTWEGRPFTGLSVQTNRAGRVVARREFKDGRYDGVVEEFDPNGTRIVLATFAAGERHGTNTYWRPDGTLLKRQRWEHGRLVESTHKEDLE